MKIEERFQGAVTHAEERGMVLVQEFRPSRWFRLTSGVTLVAESQSLQAIEKAVQASALAGPPLERCGRCGQPWRKHGVTGGWGKPYRRPCPTASASH